MPRLLYSAEISHHETLTQLEILMSQRFAYKGKLFQNRSSLENYISVCSASGLKSFYPGAMEIAHMILLNRSTYTYIKVNVSLRTHDRNYSRKVWLKRPLKFV